MTRTAHQGRRELSAVAHSVPKLGRSAWENEDSADTDPSAGRFAVADGASTSARPEVWSRLLVESFIDEWADPLAPSVLAGLRDRWNALVTGPSLPWYAQAKLLQGADSTFLGLRLDPVAGLFHAAGVGDSCLFHIRGCEVLRVGPIDDPARFGRFPELVSSRVNAAVPAATVLAGTYQPGDVFLLATDAIAKFLLETYARHGRVSPAAAFTRNRAQFIRRIARYRSRGQLANDDTTLCVVST